MDGCINGWKKHLKDWWMDVDRTEAVNPVEGFVHL
jgi:hypothetical protein